MKRLPLLAALFALPLLASACTKDGRSLVQVTVTLASGVTVDKVKLDALQSGSLLKSATYDWRDTTQTVMTFGIYMPEGTSGTVNIDATGILGDAANSHGSGEAKDVSGANTATATITLSPGAPPAPDGGTDTAGSGGGSGSGGATGSGGADGGNPDVPVGSGGSGSGGTAGGSGSGGAGGSGSGGAAGSGSGGAAGSGSGGATAKWGTPESIGMDPDAYDNWGSYYSGDAYVALAINDSGTAMVAYVNGGKLYVRRRAAHGTWLAAEEIETRAGADVTLPQIGVVSDGTAWITWKQIATTADFKRGIYEMYFNGTAWGTKRQILDDSDGSAYISHYRMAVNEVDGTAVLCSNWDSVEMRCMFRSASTWTAEKSILTWNASMAMSEWLMSLAIDNNGHAFLAWYMGTYDSGTSTSSYFITGAVGKLSDASSQNVWTTSKLSGTVSGEPLPSVHLDRSGSGVVAWTVFSSTREVHARLISPDGSLSAEQTIDSAVRADHPGAVMDGNLNATVVWPHRTTFTTPSVWNMTSSRHLSGGAWPGQPTDLETNSSTTETLFGYQPAVAVNRQNAVTAVWVEEAQDINQDYVLRRILKATRFDGSWSPVIRLDTGGASGSSFFPVVASSNVSTVAAWWQGTVPTSFGATLQAIVFE